MVFSQKVFCSYEAGRANPQRDAKSEGSGLRLPIGEHDTEADLLSYDRRRAAL